MPHYNDFLLRVFEPDSDKFTSLGEFETCEATLVEALRRVTQRKVRQEIKKLI